MIQTFEFKGSVFPSHQPFSLFLNQKFTFNKATEKEWGFSGQLNIQVSGPQIKAIFETANSLEIDFPAFVNVVKMHIRILLDIACFSYPAPYDFSLESFSLNGIEEQINIAPIKQLEFISQGISLKTLTNLATKSVDLRHALESLRLSVRNPSNLAYFSYKAIEAVRHHFQVSRDSKKAWIKMKNALNIKSNSWFDEICEASKNQRHADTENITGLEQEKFTKQAWEVVRRFIALLSTNSTTLHIDDFPNL